MGNMDDAFLRRVRIKAYFPPPDEADRRAIWQRLLPPSDARDDDVDIGLLAGDFALTGGEIRNAVFTAHLLAADAGVSLSMRHLVAGLWRELAKTGRMTDVSSLGEWRGAIAI
jgi:SpoVK/Ycf46/Vps4 family AAA+-type ATPase